MNAKRENQAFWDLRDSPMQFTPEQWDEHYRQLARWLVHDNAEIRSCAVERLTMAVFCAEPHCVPFKERIKAREDALGMARLAWLRRELETAAQTHTDTISNLLKELRHKGDAEPFREPLIGWMQDLLASLHAGASPGVVQGTMVLLEPVMGDWHKQAKRWIALLDHHSDYVRACAAKMLGGVCRDDSTDPTEIEVINIISAKELARPGIAGPFYGDSSMRQEWGQHTLWMLDLLERREGEPPADMPFNDIDFYLHELCSHSPDLVRRMMRNGFDELAVMTATEELYIVPGMEPILRELAESDKATVAASAARHLAYHYRQPESG
jgi:hypothetical protein